MPEKPLTLVMLRVEVAEEPAWMLMLLGLAVIEKSGAVLVAKVAVCTVSGRGVGPPLTIVTHTFGETLVLLQPVWNANGVPDVGLVTL
jgi:hypothetical protein